MLVASGAALIHEGATVPPLLCSTAPAVLLASSAVAPAALWYGIDPPAPPAIFAAVTAFVAWGAALTHDGATVVPLLCSTAPAVLLASSAVAPAALWYGIDPPAPPARFAAVTALVALAAVIEDELTHDGATVVPLLCSTAPAVLLASSAVAPAALW